MLLTIGIPSYMNAGEVWFTIQCLRTYCSIDFSCTEILVVDNWGMVETSGRSVLQGYIKSCNNNNIRYVQYTEVVGVSAAKNKIFELARGKYVLCIDSHILLDKNFFKDMELPEGGDLVQGPLLLSDGGYHIDRLDSWENGFWTKWGRPIYDLPKHSVPIWANGAGMFLTSRKDWLGFNKNFIGFGGETGYIQEKYRMNGRKVLCNPKLVWQHLFFCYGKIKYPVTVEEKIRNYLFAYYEIGRDTTEIYNNFDYALVEDIDTKLVRPFL